MSDLSVEELIVHAKNGVAGAENELVKQAAAWIKPFMHYPAHHPPEWRDIDALESALLEAALVAIRKYDPGHPRRGSLQSFVTRYVCLRRRDFLRNQWRKEHPYNHSADVEQVLERQSRKSRRTGKHDLGPVPADGDPAHLAERREILLIAAEVGTHRTTMAYAAWESAREGRAVRAFARQYDLSYWGAVQIREQLFADIRVVLDGTDAVRNACVTLAYDTAQSVTYTYDQCPGATLAGPDWHPIPGIPHAGNDIAQQHCPMRQQQPKQPFPGRRS